ncbi:LacI family DNA-binding transcriptional regulator [Streptomyces sulphureus]|uniref:LacI family DNA-binding transcriptional regulator n=1 Tax=Streptomyces sulphureus TaxID=47758 RepID=UPI000367E61F|nr:LacI family DNA-binding transcriptional regulator [Streptomyces sulphureus]
MSDRDGSAGRRPTLSDVASRAAVSPGLASLALRGAHGPSERSRARVLEAAAELGYRPDVAARLLARHRSHLLGVVYALQHSFHADVIEQLYVAAEEAGLEVMLSAVTSSRTPQRAVETLLDNRCEGVVLLGAENLPEEIFAQVSGVPTVVIGRSSRAPLAGAVVRTPGDLGVRQAVEHLAGLGHKRITHLDGGAGPSSRERRRGYELAMTEHGLGAGIRTVPGGPSEEDGVAGARTLLEGELPTAVLAYNDSAATALIHTLLRAGVRVPEHLSVVGYDDSHLARLAHLRLTTVAQDVARLASVAVRHVTARLEGDEAAPEEVVPPRLVVRSTTAEPRIDPTGSASVGR